jgi:hypothetical protein
MAGPHPLEVLIVVRIYGGELAKYNNKLYTVILTERL